MLKLENKLLLVEKSYVDGQWIGNGDSFEVTNPADGSVVGKVYDLAADDVRDAIQKADGALPEWRAKTAAERGKILSRWADLIVQNCDDLAQIMTEEQGKPLSEAAGEIKYGASFLQWFAEEGKRTYGETIPSPFKDARLLTIKQPVGVCATITPWNFPSAMITRKVGPALAAGCTVVSRPAANTPLSALALAVLAEEAGVPPGVLNIVVTSDASGTGKIFCESDVVRKLSFTGSTQVGRILMKQCADTIKKVSFELGGNAPFIVFDDADIDAAVDGAIACKFRNAGQTCVCANRIYVQDSVYDEFAEKFVEKVKALKLGDGADQGVDVGPVIDESAVEKVEEHIKDATMHGAEVLAGGQRSDLGGAFFEPTVLGGMKKEMKISCEETFGPVAPLYRFKDEEEVVQLANDTIFGLASYFYARDLGRVWRVAEALEYGMVAVNSGILSTEVAPFGGVKQSGVGREGSKHGIDEYLEIKYIIMAGL